MKRIKEILGGLVGNRAALSAAQLATAAGSVERVVKLPKNAGPAPTGSVIENLEPRQLMFGLTVLPPVVPGTPNQFLPGTNLQFNPVNQFAFANQGGANNASANAQFGYAIPFLQQVVPAFTQFTTISEDFDNEWQAPIFGPLGWQGVRPIAAPTVPNTNFGMTGSAQAGQVPLAALNMGTTLTTEGTTDLTAQMRIDHRFSAAGVVPQLRTPAPAAAGTTSTGVGVQYPLTGIAELDFSFVTDDATDKRGLVGATVFVAGGAEGEIDFVAGNTGATRFRLTYRGLDVTSQFVFTRQIADPLPDPLEVQYVITQSPAALAAGLFPSFDTITFVRNRVAGVPAAGTDTFLVNAITATVPSDRYAAMTQARIFGADARVTGNVQFAVQQFDSQPLSTPAANVYQFPVRQGGTLVSRFVMTHGSTTGGAAPVQPTIGNFISAILPTTGANNQAVRFSITGDQFVDLQFRAGAQGGARLMTAFSFTASGAAAADVGVLDAGTRIQAFRNGQLVNWTLPDGRIVKELSDLDLAFVAADGNGWFRDAATGDVANVTYNLRNNQGFDTIRILRLPGAAGTDAITLDNVVALFPQAFLEDLYGRALQNTLDIGTGPGNSVPRVDFNGDGVPDYNDGIGRISLQGTRGFTISGGLIERDTTTNQLFLVVPDSVAGIYDEFEDAGFGFTFDNQLGTGIGTQVWGLPAGSGSVIIGSPFFRDPRSALTYHGTNPLGGAEAQFTSLPISRVAGAQTSNPVSVHNPFSPPGPGAQVQTGYQGRGVAPGNLNFVDQPLDNAADVFGNFLPANLNLPRLAPAVIRTQGIFAESLDGLSQNITSVNVHGMLFGGSVFSGSVQRMSVGNLFGSVQFQGDIGGFFNAGDAGMFLTDFGAGQVLDTGSINNTGGFITVVGTAGQIQIGGRSALGILVQGNISNPNFDRRDSLRYTEVESIAPQDPPTQTPPRIDTDEAQALNNVFGQVGSAGQGVYFGNGLYRNDGLASAEFVGGQARSAIINGRLGLVDGLNPVEDAADSFAFTTIAGTRVVLNVEFRDPPLPPPPSAQSRRTVYARVYDSFGVLVAAHQYPFATPTDRLPSEVTTARFRFDAEYTGVYYLVLTAGTDTQDDALNTAVDYTATISGMAPVSLGMYSSGMATRNTQISVTSGDVGLIRNGLGSWQGNRTLGDASEVSATIEFAAHRYDLRGVSISTTNDVHAILVGGDVLGATAISIGGDLGYFSTGNNVALGLGDIDTAALQVGGTIGIAIIRGSIGVRTVEQPGEPAGPAGDVVIATGRSGEPGHINYMATWGLIRGSGFTLRTSDNSIIDHFIVGVNGVGGADSGRIVLFQPTIEMGRNSDIRFAQLNTATPFDLAGTQGRMTVGQQGGAINENDFLIVQTGSPVTLEDDSGFSYTITLTGAGSVGYIRQIPVSGGRGAALARLDVILGLGGNMTITGIPVTGSTTGVISLGRINVQGGGNNAIRFAGPVEIDVAALNLTGLVYRSVANETPRGDFVNIAVTNIGTVFVAGDLGRTQIAGGSARFARLFAGGVPNVAALVGDNAINVQGAGERWGGDAFAPIVWGNDAAGGGGGQDGPTLEDTGSPIDNYTNGLLVGGGIVNSVRVNGWTGDVVLLNDGVLLSLVANADGVSAPGVFEGLGGNVYANAIGTIDVGDGLAPTGDTPLPIAGIFSNTIINSIIGGTRVRNPVIQGVVIAAGGAELGLPAIGSITLTSGRIENAFIGATTLDSWWRSARFAAANLNVQDQELANGIINRISVTGGSIFGTRILGQQINSVTAIRGNIDASVIEAIGVPASSLALQGLLGTVAADNILNSTSASEPLEYRFSTIRSSGNTTNIRVNNLAVGSISDTLIAIGGRLTGAISALNLIRDTITVTGSIAAIRTNNDIRSTLIVSGGLTSLIIGGDLRSATINSAGALQTVTVTGSVTASIIDSSGPNGRIGVLTVGNGLDADVTSSGPIASIRVTKGDFSGSVRTTDPTDGVLTTLNVGRDILANIAVAGNITSIIAGRHIGQRIALTETSVSTPNVISVDGTLGTLTAGGQLYSDVLVGQSITGAVSFGARVRAFNRPGGTGADQVSDARIVAFGRILSVAITGDFAGSIRSESGGIGTISITNGSLRRAANGDAASVVVNDGDLSALRIVNGSLFGDVIVRDGSINSLSVTGAGAFGHIGVNPNLSSGNTITGDVFRNQLPPDVAATSGIDGPRIWAGRDLTMTVAGSVFEAGIYAGGTVRSVAISGSFLSDQFTDAEAGLRNIAGYIAAGDLITSVSISGRAQGLSVLAGIAPRHADFAPDFGADNQIGGTGVNADAIKSGRVNAVTIAGGGTLIPASNTVVIGAGVSAGTDGIYGTDDGDNSERAAAGLSAVIAVSVGGPVSTTADSRIRVKADSGITSVAGAGAANVLRSLATTPDATVPSFNDLAFPVTGGTSATTLLTLGGANTVITLPSGGQIRVRVSGTNIAAAIVTDTATGTTRLLIRNTIVPSSANFNARIATVSSIIIEPNIASPATELANFTLTTADDVSVASLSIALPLSGNSNAYVDGDLGTLVTRTVSTIGIIRAGGAMNSVAIGNQSGTPVGNTLQLRAATLGTVTFYGGVVGATSRIDATSLTTLASRGNFSGVVSINRDIGSVTVTRGQLVDASIRAGGGITSVTGNGLLRSVISARGDIRTVTMTPVTFTVTGLTTVLPGSMVQSQIVAGVDLGGNGQFGSIGNDADVVTNGNITTVTIAGVVTQSDVAAGITRGNDGFYGTSDDAASSGRSNIGAVTATGGIVPTALQSQSYRVVSTGTLGIVRSGPAVVNAPIGNFRTDRLATQATPLRVTSLTVNELGGSYTARITFSRGVLATTLISALLIANLRADGTLVGLVGGDSSADYTVLYDPATFTAEIRFNRAVTTRNLARNTAAGSDAEANVAGPGAFRFTLDAAVLRPVDLGGRIDGNGDGVSGDNYNFTTVVGDAGDRTRSTTGLTGQQLVSFYGPAPLDAMMSADGLQTGQTLSGSRYTVRGSLGDHADQSPGVFGAGADLDLYSITLQAGQVLRIGPLRGVAVTAVINLLGANGLPAGGVQALPVGAALPGELNVEQAFLVSRTGQYIIAIGAPDPLDPTSINAGFFRASAIDPTVSVINQRDVLNPGAVQNATGEYNFQVAVESDATSGFSGINLARDLGAPVSPAPTTDLANFAASVATLSTRALSGASTFVFSYNLGTDGLPGAIGGTLVGGRLVGGTNDDFVTGTNGSVTVRRDPGVDLTFGTADDVITSTVTANAGATVAGGNTAANLPANTDFVTPTSTVVRGASAGGNFNFNLFLGADNIRGINGNTNDDFIMGNNGGTVIVRTAGADFILGDDPTTPGANEGADDVITTFDNRPLLLPLANASSASGAITPRNTNFPTATSVVSVVRTDNSGFAWRLDLGIDGLRNSNTSATPFQAGDDRVIGENNPGGTPTIRIIAGPGADGIFGNVPIAAGGTNTEGADDTIEIRLLATPLAGTSNLAAPVPSVVNFAVPTTVTIANTRGGAPAQTFVFGYNAGPDGFRGVHNGRNDDFVSATASANPGVLPAVTVVRTAGADQLFGTTDDVVTPNPVLLSNVTNANVPSPVNFAGSLTSPITRLGTQGDTYTYRFRAGQTAAQNTIVGYSEANTVTRTSGVDGVLGDNPATLGDEGADDVIRVASNLAAGTDIPTAPRPSAFANLLGTPTNAQVIAALNTSAALGFIDVGKWRFTLDAGANGRFDGDGLTTAKSDDVVVGTTTTGQRVEYRAGTTGVFGGLANGDVLTLSDGIGDSAVRGQPSEAVSDVDVFNLNNGQPIVAGTRYRVTLRTSETGGNFGALSPQRFSFGNDVGFQINDLRALVQFALFERTNSANITDGQLVASPTRINLFGGTANTVLADNNSAGYGFDAAGDFYLEFTTPPSQADASQAGIFSLYVQGAVASRYGIEIRQLSTAVPLVNRTQNIFIETQGGIINWLESSGRSTVLSAYDSRVNGFSGLIGTQTVIDYILNGSADRRQPGLVRALNDMFFNAAGNGPTGFDASSVVVSASNANLVGQQYSTIFLTGSLDPSAFFNNGTFGAVQRTDIFNANLTDESVVFAPSLNALGNAPTPAGVDSFIRDLTFIMGRQIGQLMGLRFTAGADPAPLPAPNGPLVVNAMAVSGDPLGSGRAVPPFGATPLPPLPALVAGAGPRFVNAAAALAGTGSSAAAGTQFFLGQQNSEALLRRIFGR